MECDNTSSRFSVLNTRTNQLSNNSNNYIASGGSPRAFVNTVRTSERFREYFNRVKVRYYV